MTIEYILRHFSKVRYVPYHIFLGMYTKTIFGCSDTDMLFYLLFWLGRTSGFCSHQKNKACQEKRQKNVNVLIWKDVPT